VRKSLPVVGYHPGGNQCQHQPQHLHRLPRMRQGMQQKITGVHKGLEMISIEQSKPSKSRMKPSTVFMFIYGLLAGTSAPLLLARCASSGGCANCGGACGAAIGIVPLLLYFALRGRTGAFRSRASALFSRLIRRAE
jgi:hypothetical protein